MYFGTTVSAKGLGAYHSREEVTEKPGHWLGKAAKEIGLEGEVSPEDLRKVAHGKSPDGERLKIVRSDAKAGNELVFSVDKVWSVLALVGGDKRITEAFEMSVTETLTQMERIATEARIRTNGNDYREQTGNFIAANFNHLTTRPTKTASAMPLMHQHSIIFYSTICSDGNWRRLEGEQYFAKKRPQLVEFFQRRFIERLEEMDYKVTRKGTAIHCADIPESKVKAFSPRKEQIHADLKQWGKNPTAKQRRFSALKGRQPKSELSLPDLKKQWRQLADEQGIDFSQVRGFIETPEKFEPLSLGEASPFVHSDYKEYFNQADSTNDPKVLNRLLDTIELEQAINDIGIESDIDELTDSEIAELLRPEHLTEEQWQELVIESGISPEIASKTFKNLAPTTESGEESPAFRYVLETYLGELAGQSNQYATDQVSRIKDIYANLHHGGYWCRGSEGWGEVKANVPRIRYDSDKEVKYEPVLGVDKGITLPHSKNWDWDAVRNDPSIDLGITEGAKKAASTSSHGLLTIGLGGMTGGVKEGRLNHELEKFNWKGRNVKLILDKDPSHKLKTMRDAARELYKMAALLEYYGAKVQIGTIPGKLTQKVGIDDHLVAGRTLDDIKWQDPDTFVKESSYLAQKYKEHNERRLGRKKAKPRKVITLKPTGKKLVAGPSGKAVDILPSTQKVLDKRKLSAKEYFEGKDPQKGTKAKQKKVSGPTQPKTIKKPLKRKQTRYTGLEL